MGEQGYGLVPVINDPDHDVMSNPVVEKMREEAQKAAIENFKKLMDKIVKADKDSVEQDYANIAEKSYEDALKSQDKEGFNKLNIDDLKDIKKIKHHVLELQSIMNFPHISKVPKFLGVIYMFMVNPALIKFIASDEFLDLVE